MYQRPDMFGVILPAIYEMYPQYFFDTRIIQKVYDYVYSHEFGGAVQGEHVHNVEHIYVNYTSYLPYGENQIAYFTEDIGLSSYYCLVELASYMYHHVCYCPRPVHPPYRIIPRVNINCTRALLIMI